MTNYTYKLFISWLLIALISFLTFSVMFLAEQDDFLLLSLSENTELDIKTTKILTGCIIHIDSLESETERLLKYVNENSAMPNEKRKALFQLKIEQDSALIKLLSGDIKSNNEILKLLDSSWKYNKDTKFKSLND